MNGSFKKLFHKIREGLSYKQEKVKLDFTVQLQELMEKKGINKAQLARSVGKSGPYITKIMKGECNFTIESMVELADAIDGKLELHVVPREEEIVAWYKSIKTARKNKDLKRPSLGVESIDPTGPQINLSSTYFPENGDNGYSIAA